MRKYCSGHISTCPQKIKDKTLLWRIMLHLFPSPGLYKPKKKLCLPMIGQCNLLPFKYTDHSPSTKKKLPTNSLGQHFIIETKCESHIEILKFLN